MATTRAPESVVREVFGDVHWTHRGSRGNAEVMLGLTPRDVLLLLWAADGVSRAEMARRGGVSTSAMDGYWFRMLRHLGAPNSAAAVAEAFRAGIIQ